MKTPLPNSYWVRPGLLLGGEHPWQVDESTTISRLVQLQQAGIDSFIDLTEPGERPDYQLLLSDDVHYQRCALVDHGVPASPSAMATVVELLEQQLVEGRGVYVHCRAGIGRTGMVLACHLIAAGDTPSVALERLNRLWKQNQRSRQWPRVPETPQQTEFVLQWQPVAGNISTGAPSLQERARGMVIGAATGDAFAVPSQGLAAGQAPWFTELRGGGPSALPPGAWTDDTAVLRCIGESLLQPRGFDPREALALLQRWSRDGQFSADGRAIGLRPTLARAIARAGWRRGALTGLHDPQQRDPDPLLRCVPVALRYGGDLPRALAIVDEVTGLTHQAGLVRETCRLFTCLLVDALTVDSAAGLMGASARWRGLAWSAGPQALLAGWQSLRNPQPAPEAGTILAALDTAVRATLSSRDFVSGLMTCTHAGGDTDVATAAAGALLGGLGGEAVIPTTWRATLLQAVELRNLADRLLQDPA